MPREGSNAFRISDVVDSALQLSSIQLRNVAHLERRVSDALVSAAISQDELIRSLSELVCAAAARLDAPRPGASRWLRVSGRLESGAVHLSVEHGAAEGVVTSIVVAMNHDDALALH